MNNIERVRINSYLVTSKRGSSHKVPDIEISEIKFGSGGKKTGPWHLFILYSAEWQREGISQSSESL